MFVNLLWLNWLTNAYFIISSRQLATNDIVIKTPKRSRKSRPNTPKWIPVSQDSGALITDELSQLHSPISRNTRPPRTPKDKINEEYEPRVKKPKAKPKKVKPRKVEVKPKTKTKTKPKSKRKKVEPQPDNDLVNDLDDDQDQDFDNAQEESDIELDDLYVNGTMEVKISRLPTSSIRLTSIDIILQSLNDALTHEDGKHFQIFQKLNKLHLNKILDLNLTNNHYLYKLKDLKSTKLDLRNELFDKRQEINENLVKLENLRNQYNKVHQLIKTKKQIIGKLNNLSKSSSDNNDSILMKLNKLNNIVDPNWGILDKLKEINSKFHELDWYEVNLFNDYNDIQWF